MKLSEAKKYKKLISALKGTEISNEEVQKTLNECGLYNCILNCRRHYFI